MVSKFYFKCNKFDNWKIYRVLKLGLELLSYFDIIKEFLHYKEDNHDFKSWSEYNERWILYIYI